MLSSSQQACLQRNASKTDWETEKKTQKMNSFWVKFHTFKGNAELSILSNIHNIFQYTKGIVIFACCCNKATANRS